MVILAFCFEDHFFTKRDYRTELAVFLALRLFRFMAVCLDPPMIVMQYYSHGSLFDLLSVSGTPLRIYLCLAPANLTTLGPDCCLD